MPRPAKWRPQLLPLPVASPLAAVAGDLAERRRVLLPKSLPLPAANPADAGRPNGEFATTAGANKRARAAQQADPLPFYVTDIFTYQAFATIEAAVQAYVDRPYKHMPRLGSLAGDLIDGTGKPGNRPGGQQVALMVRQLKFERSVAAKMVRIRAKATRASQVEYDETFGDDSDPEHSSPEAPQG